MKYVRRQCGRMARRLPTCQRNSETSVLYNSGNGEGGLEMRKIEFRGKRKDNDAWAFGGFTPDAIGCPRITVKDGDGLLFPKVVPETVGQYTGLTDKHGVKIFEGDVVRIENGIDEETIVGCIVYDYASWQIDYGLDATALWTQLVELAEYKSTEVLGNIHDNPGLVSRE
jgi:hypothetical protein